MVKQTFKEGECLTFLPQLASQTKKKKDKKKDRLFQQIKPRRTDRHAFGALHADSRHVHLADIWRFGFKGHGPLPLTEIDAHGYTLQRKPQQGV